MLDDRQKRESESTIKQLIKANKVVKPHSKAESFFLDKAFNALQISKRLLEISEDREDPLEGYTWVINASYYCMFYAATSLLAHFEHKISTETGIHKLTFHALVYYFLIDDNKLQKHFIEQYKESYESAEQLLQISEEKAAEMIKHFQFEHSKRTRFTYEMGKIAERNKAKTSLERAEGFLVEVRKLIGI